MIVNRLLAKCTMICAFLLAALVGFSQTRQISGKVTDSKDGSPVSNASVTIKGTKTGTTTDVSGNFKINVTGSSSVLVISSVGFNKIEVPVGNQSQVDVSLVSSSAALTEVVVVGYGTQRKKDLTGAVATVTSKDFVKGALQSPEQLIAGKVAGVQITPGGGSPGSGSRIRIRGGASLNASNDPLIVIDGLPVDNGGIAGSSNPLNLINPNDIETFTILKDPSAAAIYGSRASNGVILITTKKGSKGKLRYSFSAQGFLQVASNQVDVLSADQLKNILTSEGGPTNLLGSANTNWQDQIYRKAFGQDYNFSILGSMINGKWPFRISGGYLNQDGILKTDNFKRLTGSINLSPKFLNDRLKVDLNLKLSGTNNRFANTGAIGSAVQFDPTQQLKSGNDNYGGWWEWVKTNGLPISVGDEPNASNPNPMGLLEFNTNRSQVFRSIGNIQFDYSIPFVKGLRANLNLGYDYSQGRGLNTTDSRAASEFGRRGSFSPYTDQRFNKLFDFYFNYVKDIKSIKSRVDVMAGTGYQDFQFYNFNFPSRRFNGDTIPGSNPRFISQTQGFTLISYYGRLNYTLNNKYVLTFNVRTDGTSKFPKANRWGVFPSAAVAWRVSEEAFLANSKVISDLKLRVGYGVTGQQDGIPFYGFIPSYDVSTENATYQLGNSFVQMLRPRAYDIDLRWETTTNTNIALDFGLFNNRISGTVDFFKRETKDLLSVVPVQAGTNFTNQLFTNVGNISSTGFEVTINTTPVKNNKIQWDFGVNFTYVVPEITNLLINEDPNFKGVQVGGISGGTGNTIQRHIVGERPYAFFVYKQIYDQAGKPIEGLYEDINRDGTINEDDRYLYNSPDPRFFLGLNSSVSVGKFTAGFVMRANIGNYIYDNFSSDRGVLRQSWLVEPRGVIRNLATDYLNTRFQNNQYFSDYYVKNASFLRVDNINFGYDFGEVYKNVRLRATANIQNAFVITKYKGLDPEVAGGIDNTTYPRPRMYALGINLDF